MTRKAGFVVLGSILVLGLVGCAGAAEETATSAASPAYDDLISVTGEVVPATWASVSAQAAGKVVEVSVEPGDAVAEGDVLLRLDDADAQLALQQARAALSSAEAELANLQAPARSERVAAAEARVQSARAALDEAEAMRTQLTSGTFTAEITAAETEVAAAEQAQKAAQLNYDDLRARKDDGEQIDVWQVQEAALRLRAADKAVAAAQMRLAYLRRSLETRTREADASVQVAAAQREIAQAQLDLLHAGAMDEDVAIAQAALAQADAGLAQAQLALSRTELRAPLAGTVGEVNVRVGESVVPGQPLIVIGDLATLRVETTDLDEADVAKIAPGQQVAVTFDTIPDQAFDGTVVRISPKASSGSGGVNYTTVIELDELDPAVRWGMTAFVDIEARE